ncbi:MAG TPA: SRPBCC domain-containing protein, partial [Phycisphaerae bacterium]|nr:SRPBCC domain-containing protein [Phycisphaerae bacterium]
MAEKTKTVIDAPSERQIAITRVVEAPRELVWEAWTNPVHVANWWGPRGFTTTIHEMDVRPGGVWHHTMHGPDGTDYPNKSVFTEVVKPERIVFSHGGGTGVHFQATWTFEDLDGKTKVTIRMVFPTVEDRDRVVKKYSAIEGGNQTLARLAQLMEKAPVIIERTFDAPIETVWNALTDKNQITQWSFDIKKFKPVVGFEFQFDKQKGGVKYIHLCKITEVIPHKKLAYTWRYDGYPGDSLVTIELFAAASKTKIKLTHAGLQTFLPESNPYFARGNFFQGWMQIIDVLLRQFVQKSAPSDDRDFVITRVLSAPRELVFKAWTDPRHMAQWWGPHHFTNSVCEMDVRPGGAYRIVMRSPDGIEYPINGVFREIAAPERLVMTMDCSEHPDAWHDLVNPQRGADRNPAG